MARISVLTLNLWNIQQPLDERMERLGEFVAATAPDVVALQEVSRSSGRLQSELIAEMADYPFHHYARSGAWRGREEGLSVLTRERSEPVDRFSLTHEHDDMMRCLQVVKWMCPLSAHSVLVGNTHFAFGRRAHSGRVRQATLVSNALFQLAAGGTTGAILLCGDLNDTPDSIAVLTLLEDRRISLKDAWAAVNGPDPGLTVCSANRWAAEGPGLDRRIDYILVPHAAEIRDARLVLTENGPPGPVSDHYGVWVDLDLPI